MEEVTLLPFMLGIELNEIGEFIFKDQVVGDFWLVRWSSESLLEIFHNPIEGIVGEFVVFFECGLE